MAPASAVPSPPALPINWWRLDIEEQAETLEVLVEWVPELVRRYGLSDAYVPPCWYEHEALVQELLALFQYRNQQQFNEALGPPPSAPLDYHYQQQLALTRLRFWAAMTGCNSAEHFPAQVQSWADLSSVRAAMWETTVSDAIDTLRQTHSNGTEEEGSS